jgi:mono/diheme cytochrome c family protein
MTTVGDVTVSRRTLKWAGLAALGLVAGAAAWFVISINRDVPVAYDDIAEHFKYGSIGSEPGGSLFDPVGGVLPPYAVFTELPSICAEKLPGGYASLGLIYEPGHDLPIGISRRRRLGIDQVGFNCALCHTATVRESPSAPRRIVLGMPAQQLDLEALVQFVLDCSLDNRVTRESVMGRFRGEGGRVSPTERLLVRFGLVDRLKLQTLALRNRIAPILADSVPRWGRGRVDTFNPYKSIQFNWRLDRLPPAELVGAADYPSLWNQAPREGMHLHWDGNNTSVDERNLSAALGAGVTPVTVDHSAIKRVRDWIWKLPPPRYPYPIDKALAGQGAAVYRQSCFECHAGNRFREGVREGSRVGEVEDIDRIGTDPSRLNSYTEAFAANQYSLYPDSPYRFTHFRKTRGYANQPLDGIWLRGPFLHNGSVPTLRDLLEPPERRPAVFYRGYDVFDQRNVGFVSNVPEAEGRTFFRYDTSLAGNGNGGHLYGVGLPESDKRALVEYLKTF